MSSADIFERQTAERAASSVDNPALVVPGSILHPGGMVGIPAGEQARWTEFLASLIVLERPKGTRLAFVHGTYIQASRNDLVGQMLASDAQWLFMVDDDHVFDRRLLINLLDRHVPIVGAAAVSRKPPYYVCAYAHGTNHAMGILDFTPEMQEVEAVGTGAILIRREVFEALESPWFEVGFDANGRNISEDIIFCQRAREAGYDIWLDATQMIGHLTGVAIRPDGLGLRIDLDHEQSIVIPKEQIEETVEEPV
jgi:hypothetical protein